MNTNYAIDHKNPLPPIIGIAGKAGVGKDTIADYLVKEYGYTRYGFADPIKRLLNERFGWSANDWEDRQWKESPHPYYGSGRKKHLNTPHEGFSPRSWAQWLGTEVGRDTFGEDCWVEVFGRWYIAKVNQHADLECRNAQKTVADLGIAMPPPFRVVIPDVRFENEARKIRELGGRVIHLIRTGIPAVNLHVSEAGLACARGDLQIINDGTIDLLYTNFESTFNV